MTTYKVGDTVKIVDKEDSWFNCVGVVCYYDKTAIGDIISIDFGKYKSKSAMGHTCGGYAKSGNGWNYLIDYLSRISVKEAQQLEFSF